MIDLCYIAPVSLTEQAIERSDMNMVLAHIADKSEEYCKMFYESDKLTLLDNGAFENGKPYPADEMVRLGHKVGADILVLPDFPNRDWTRGWITVEMEIQTYKDAGFAVMFVPQSNKDDVKGYYQSVERALEHPQIDYIGLSIIACPNISVERVEILERYKNWSSAKKKFHILGALDRWGDELLEILPYEELVTSWDSSACVWAGVFGELIFARKEKFKKPVDFMSAYRWTEAVDLNIEYMEALNG